jgi:hypothetical protein
MQTITFDKKSNSLTVSEDGKPRAGLINCASETAYRNLLRNNISALKENIEAIDRFCEDKRNAGKINRIIELRRRRTEINLHIKAIEQRLKPISHSGIIEVSIPSSLIIKIV